MIRNNLCYLIYLTLRCMEGAVKCSPPPPAGAAFQPPLKRAIFALSTKWVKSENIYIQEPLIVLKEFLYNKHRGKMSAGFNVKYEKCN